MNRMMGNESTGGELTIKRRFSVASEKVFEAVSLNEYLAMWWGPVGVHIAENELRFDKIGPWSSVMVSQDGTRHEVSGKVLMVKPQRFVEFTWGWHDKKTGVRGHESIVRIKVEKTNDGGCEVTLQQKGFADEESYKQHAVGWKSSLSKIDILV